ncbi:YbaK/EbsC family protein [Bombilactobacillus bombi]|uniref:YbaK/EbsC family protein n=1 Tax=Bombilactobacillus bombi TaxID=1303590 RepID=UPI0015E5D7CB|nr:YbaK/EbsC family protein [Bombilactobacillus bombi]MBA1434617.1 Cys-tRNA(Pro) deacylase [Bombilactobacillus bombi]
MSKKKQRTQKTLVEKILDKHQIAYQPLAFDTQTKGDVEQIVPHQNDDIAIYKTLVLTGNKTGPLVGVLPLDKHLSYKLLAQLSGNKKVKMVPLKDLQKTSGFEHGANSPIGIREQHNYPIYFDNQALEDGQIAVSAGKIGKSVLVDVQQIAQLVSGKFGSFAVDQPD